MSCDDNKIQKAAFLIQTVIRVYFVAKHKHETLLKVSHNMKKFYIDKVYNAYVGLDAKQRKDLIRQLNSLDIPVTKIEAYTYPEVPGIRHLFFYLKNNKQPVPYFLLEEKILQIFTTELYKLLV